MECIPSPIPPAGNVRLPIMDWVQNQIASPRATNRARIHQGAGCGSGSKSGVIGVSMDCVVIVLKWIVLSNALDALPQHCSQACFRCFHEFFELKSQRRYLGRDPGLLPMP